MLDTILFKLTLIKTPRAHGLGWIAPVTTVVWVKRMITVARRGYDAIICCLKNKLTKRDFQFILLCKIGGETKLKCKLM